MKKLTLNKAISEAVAEEMRRDEKVILLGEDITTMDGGLSIFMGVPAEFGEERCLNMPIAESGFTHFATGAALAGYRPIVDLFFSDFLTCAMDAVANHAPKMRFTTNGKHNVATVYVMGNGGDFKAGCHHSQCVESWLANIPGLKIVAPYFPADIKGLMKASIRDNDPVVFLYHEGSLGLAGEIPEGEHVISLNNAANVIKEGSDVTVVAIQSLVPKALKAAEELEKEGISVEVIDPRVLIPLDKEKIIHSVRKTGRLVVAHEAPTRGGFGGEIAAVVADECFDALKAPIKRVGSKNMPIPSGLAEQFVYPQIENVIEAIRNVCK